MIDILPKELRPRLPDLYEQETIKDPIVHIKFFVPGLPQVWFLTEFSKKNQDTCFGYIIDGDQEELGYFYLTSLQESTIIERDETFTQRPLSQAKREYKLTLEEEDK